MGLAVGPQLPVPQVEAIGTCFSLTFANGSLNSSYTLTSGLVSRTGCGGSRCKGEGYLTGDSFFLFIFGAGIS